MKGCWDMVLSELIKAYAHAKTCFLYKKDNIYVLIEPYLLTDYKPEDYHRIEYFFVQSNCGIKDATNLESIAIQIENLLRK